MIDTSISGIETKRRQAATVRQLSAEVIFALDRGDWALIKILDQAIGRALESPEAAAAEQNQLDSRDPFGL